jgi:GLPGLI family protein
MKYLLLFLFFNITIYSQSTKKSKVIAVTYNLNFYNENINENEKILSAETKNQINYVTNSIKKNEYGLYILEKVSVFNIIDKIDQSEEINKFSIITKALNGGKYYCDFNNNEKIYIIDDGEKFNITKFINEYKWNLTNESKIINGYKCFKATSHKEEFSKLRKKTLSVSPIVWYAPELPFPFGPSGLDGLPGLVLEGSINGKTYFYATKINFDYKEKIDFERPKSGKYITPEEYEDLQIKMINDRIKD